MPLAALICGVKRASVNVDNLKLQPKCQEYLLLSYKQYYDF